MLLTCPTCHHKWDEPVAAGARDVLCPECIGKVPIPAAVDADDELNAPTRRMPALNESHLSRASLDASNETTLSSQRTRAQNTSIHGAETLMFGSTETNLSAFHDGKTEQLDPDEPTRRLVVPPSLEDDASAATRRISGAREVTKETAPVAPAQKIPEPRERATRSRDDLKRQYEELIGRNLDGYRVEKLLGAGGMGAVYLAHQIALDRKVALKILPAHLAGNFDLVARFTREALSAAQLTHHNVVQVYDVGTSGGVHYFVMEFIRGESLGQIIRRDGPLRVDDAAGYVLQAARGLHYAHERGIIHRDIKPDNLMVNEHGIVKIADMGLAKMRGTVEERYEFDPNDASKFAAATNIDLTLSNMALGTPAYMAPEQARDTASVDPRADQYSLGCTLYYLCAGKAPYSGTTAFELMSKHLKEPLIPIETHVRGVPPAFSTIIRKMLAKDPKDRFETLKDAAKAIEQYLGIDSETGPYKPREHHLAVLEDCQKEYYAAKSRKHRRVAVMAFLFLIPVIMLLAFLSKNFMVIGAALAVAVLVPLASIIINGIANRTYMYRRLRAAAFGMNWRGWAQTVLGIVALGAFLILTGWIWSWLGVLVFAAGLAAAYQMLVLRPLRQQRAGAIAKMLEMLKELRLRGLPEEAIQDFVCRFSGADWQEFFEEFFSYEDMLLARARLAAADKVTARHKWALWRDPLFRAFDRIEETRRLRREQKTLARAEKDRLKAEGVEESKAAEMAEVEATRILKSGLVLQPPKQDHEVTTRRRLRLGGPLRIGFRVFRFAAGAAVAAAAIVAILAMYKVNLPIPDNITSLLRAYYSKNFIWGNAAFISQAILFLAGVALLVSAFSRRIFMPAVLLLGVLMFAFAVPLIRIVNQPQFNITTLFLAAGAMIVIGFGFPMMSKLTGGKF